MTQDWIHLDSQGEPSARENDYIVNGPSRSCKRWLIWPSPARGSLSYVCQKTQWPTARLSTWAVKTLTIPEGTLEEKQATLHLWNSSNGEYQLEMPLLPEKKWIEKSVTVEAPLFSNQGLNPWENMWESYPVEIPWLEREGELLPASW